MGTTFLKFANVILKEENDILERNNTFTFSNQLLAISLGHRSFGDDRRGDRHSPDDKQNREHNNAAA